MARVREVIKTAKLIESGEEKKIDFEAIAMKLASPEVIHKWSHGEVKKPETINYRTFRPEKDGLFDEKIFGPTKDWECYCGKYKRIKYREITCDRCGVTVTSSKVRRERMGHIELASPVSHVWFLKSIPSRIGVLLDMTTKELERVIYYESYIVTESNTDQLKKKQLLNEEDLQKCKSSLGASTFKAKIGAAAIKDLLLELDLDKLAKELKEEHKETESVAKKKDIIKRLRIAESFRKSGNRPEWMVLDVLPVIPPDLRPLVPLDGSRFASSDLNDLYRRVINRNNRLKRLVEAKAPDIIIHNEKRMLQEAVDALFDNGRRGQPVKGSRNKPLKSLSDMLKGKQGRFRQNLLGKRVDYSGRSVIVVGPELKFYQAGIPKKMLLELFKPFIIKKLEDRGYVHTVKSARKMVENVKPEVWEILEEVIKEHPIMLNRAPTLHRQGIQGFEAVPVEGSAIRLHPLACNAFNADFDGDQMAVHVPLSPEAILEVRTLILSTNNVFSTSNGFPLATPSREMITGLYYLTLYRPDIRLKKKTKKGDGKIFSTPRELLLAYSLGEVDMEAIVKVRMKDGEKPIEATAGMVMFYEALPEGMFDSAEELFTELKLEHLKKFNQGPISGEMAESFGPISADLKAGSEELTTEVEKRMWHKLYEEKAHLEGLKTDLFRSYLFYGKGGGFKSDRFKSYIDTIAMRCQKKLGTSQTVEMLDNLKDLGLVYATKLGSTLPTDDIVEPKAIKDESLAKDVKLKPGLLRNVEYDKDLLAKGEFERDSYIAVTRNKVAGILENYRKGVITYNEKYQNVIDIWSHATVTVDKALRNTLRKDEDGLNPLFIMIQTGSRGSWQQARQLAGMRGLIAKPRAKVTGEAGEIVETPITSNFKRGLNVLEYYISTHGGRKGLIDTALKTSEAGYLTRRLIDVAQDVVVAEEDCKTLRGVTVGALKNGDETLESLSDRIIGRVALDNITDLITSEVIVKSGEVIDEEKAQKIEETGIEKIRIRSVLRCEAKTGICAKCYGWNLGYRKIVNIGEAVGITAAQSIGEPGTQLTLRTFHTGGTAQRKTTQNKVVAKFDGKVVYDNMKTITTRGGRVILISRTGKIVVEQARSKSGVKAQAKEKREEFELPYGSQLYFKDGADVKEKDTLGDWDPFSTPIISHNDGTVVCVDITKGQTLKEEVNPETKMSEFVIVPQKEGKLHPAVHIMAGGEIKEKISLPEGTIMMVNTDENAAATKVHVGDVIAKMPIGGGKAHDITGGLQRVSELFEARKPKDMATISDIEGMVEIGDVTKRQREIRVTDENGEVAKYQVPQGKHLIVTSGEKVLNGDPLTAGPINPHDILRAKSENDAQEYLLGNIQEVYRVQGVNVNDKHIEVVIRQMLKKVRIESEGDTEFLPGQEVDKNILKEENEKVMKKKGKAATFKPILLGITKASLGTESVFAAASFQETTRVLTDAATVGKVDTLRGLKENIIIGRLIPAGTGSRGYRNLHIEQDEEDLPIIEEKEISAEEPLEAIKAALKDEE